MQVCLEFPNYLVDLTIYLLDLNEEVSLSLGIMVYDAQRQMLTNVILLCILYMVCIGINIVIILMMKERKKISIHYYYFLKIINSPISTKV